MLKIKDVSWKFHAGWDVKINDFIKPIYWPTATDLC